MRGQASPVAGVRRALPRGPLLAFLVSVTLFAPCLVSAQQGQGASEQSAPWYGYLSGNRAEQAQELVADIDERADSATSLGRDARELLRWLTWEIALAEADAITREWKRWADSGKQAGLRSALGSTGTELSRLQRGLRGALQALEGDGTGQSADADGGPDADGSPDADPDTAETRDTGDTTETRRNRLLQEALSAAKAYREVRSVYADRLEAHGRSAARAMVIRDFLDDFAVESVSVNRRFPLFVADGLRERDVAVETDEDDVLERIRSRKAPEEIAFIRDAQRATEDAMKAAEGLFERASIDSSGLLVLDGDPVTSERVKSCIERDLLDHGFSIEGTIVASGTDSARPHDRGSGPIEADEPIIVDVFPWSTTSQYHADMTRTFVTGTPDPVIRAFYETTREAKAAALEVVEPGVTGRAVHEAVCEVYEEAGYPTLRTDDSTETGFIHNTGHGVGLDVHEQPTLSADGGELEVGNVITIEPGLYDPAVGGVRIEDLVVVTENGYENLTDYPESLVVGPS
mgnify:CR=1 FL=1